MSPGRETVLRVAAAAGTLAFVIWAIYWKRKKDKRDKREAIEKEIKGRNYEQNKAKAIAAVAAAKDETAEDSNEIVTKKEATTTEKPAARSIKKPQSAAPVNPLQERRVEVEVKISKDEVAAFAGRGSVNIRRLQNETNTRINGRTLDNGDKIYFISGLPDDVEMAEQKIKCFLMSLPVVSSLEVLVPERVLGRIIGKSGTNIRAIQDSSGARIDIARSVSDRFLDSSENKYNEEGELLRSVMIKGNEEQIAFARKQILDEVELDISIRNRVKRAAATRPPRVAMNAPKEKLSQKEESPEDEFNKEEPFVIDHRLTFTLRPDRSMEVYVSCVYHPNSFYVQVVTKEFGELDRLCDQLTTHYREYPKPETEQLYVGDLVGAYFEQDRKWHRAKILEMNDAGIEVIYVDFGDKRTLSPKLVRRMQPQFLRLRFQAIELSLNLECPDGIWSDDAINTFVNLVGAGQWNLIFKAKVIKYLEIDDRDVLWVELIGREGISIGEELVRRGLAEQTADSESANGDYEDTNGNNGNSNGKSSSAASSKTNSNSGESSAGGRPRRLSYSDVAAAGTTKPE